MTDPVLSFYAQVAAKKEVAKYGPGTAAYADSDHIAYALSQVLMRTSRPIKVIVGGAGFSGLSFARVVEMGKLENVSLQIYEKNNELGGTWYENRCPGCACDVPIHNYQFSWAPYPYFPNFYAKRDHMFEYITEIAKQFNLRKYVKVSHKITGAKWIQEKRKWQVQIVRTDGRKLVVADGNDRDAEIGEPFIDECDVFINATGAYNNWQWPSIPNRTAFKGTLVHSASWPSDLGLAGRTVALIDNGSSGIQILPSILHEVDKVFYFVRNKTWVTSPLGARFAGPNGTNKNFSEEGILAWISNPDSYLEYKKEIEEDLNSRFPLFIEDMTAQEAARKMSTQSMKQRLTAKPELADELIPSYPLGCRRPTPGIGFLQARCSPKVEIIWGEVDSFTETGIKAESRQNYEVDAIICATGFNMSLAPRFPTVGENGVDLQQKWTTEDPACYLSLAAEDMPNYFLYMGPASPRG